jgi:calcium/calmodulin-dependent protein kinase I
MLGRPEVIPDLVHDSKLETKILAGYTQHVFYRSGRSVLERRVRQEERWVRERFLGQGAYGTVHLERCEGSVNDSKLRAVKEIRKCVIPGQDLNYIRELEAIAKFSHAKVSQAYSAAGKMCPYSISLTNLQYSHCFVRSNGWFDNSDTVFITMEYLENGDLQRYLTKPLPEPEARTITAQVLEGIKFMHENCFIHRDMKPGVSMHSL